MIEIIKSNAFKESRWSGGTTTQLYIHPKDGDYQKRDFKFRISIATTELMESTFTKLEGIKRIISILEGKMELSHKNRYNITLMPYEIDRFIGDWDTSSKGKVKDFNLMLKDCDGDFLYKEITGSENINFEEEVIFFVYCISGKIKISGKSLLENELAVGEGKNIEVSGKNSKIFYGYITK
ncbi:MAG: HutD family protein [Fusobacterium ulcerans]|uniref:HutD family protein n=1 Tax=Fusobacterium ulcerans TaxID=861 RepID=UPI003A87BFDF